jgi:hypothetical protein
MRNSRNFAMTLTLILVSLFPALVGSSYARLQPGSPALSNFAPSMIAETSGQPDSVDQLNRALVSEAYGKLPLRFEVNAGQADKEIKFLSRGSGYNLFLTPTEAVLALHREKVMTEADSQVSAADKGRSIVRMKLSGANPAPLIEGENALPGRSNYIIGADPGKWRRNVVSYAKVRYRSVYPGIDMVYYGNQQQLEYDFVVAPGADPKIIKLSFDGVRRMEVDAQGDLVLYTEGGQLRQRKPLTYQEVNGRRQEIASHYVLTGRRQVGFKLGAYDRARPLVIDPTLVYSGFLGGLNGDGITDIAVDAAGNAYVMGFTSSFDFPLVNPLQTNCNGCPNLGDIFVTKLNPEGSALIYSTYIGGSSSENPGDIAVDEMGNAYVTGYTFSNDFPTSNPLQPVKAGIFSDDAFVAKLNADGSAFFYSTYLGGSGNERNTSLAIDGEGNVYVTGSTDSADFPTSNPLQPALGGFQDVFVTKLNSAGSALVFSTFLGGSNGDSTGGIAIGPNNAVYLVGSTSSTNFPTANAFQPGLAIQPGSFVQSDAFVTKLASDGSALIYSTYFGGTGREFGNAIAVDNFGNAYVAGFTDSTNLPTMNPLQPALSGTSDGFVTKFNQSGSALQYSTYLGGSNFDEASSIAVNAQGNAYITGVTGSLNFPTLDALLPMPNDPSPFPQNGFFSKLNAGGSSFVFSSYLGGNNFDVSSKIAVDSGGDVYIVGFTNSTDFPTTPAVFQASLRGSIDGFIIKIRDGNLPPIISAAPVTLAEAAPATNSTIATVSDPNQAANTLVVTIDSSTSATVNGVTVSNITADASGEVKADVVAVCGASSAGFTLRVTDSEGLFAEATLDVTVTPENVEPTITLKPAISLWPPTHTYSTVTIAQMVESVNDNCSLLSLGDVLIEKVTSDEPDNALDDGNTINDIVIAPDCRSVQLRAERAETNDGRVYTITLRLRDSRGNVTRQDFEVSVPVDQSGIPAVKGAAAHTVTGGCQ